MEIPVIFLHGALGSAPMFDELIAHRPEGTPAYAWSFPGHGGQAWAEQFSIQAFAEFTLQKMDENALSVCRFYGYSMGGYVGLYIARHFPDRVSSVRTLGTKFDWTPETAAREASRLDPETMLAKIPAFAEILAARHSPGDWKELVRKTAEMLLTMGEHPPLKASDWPQIRQNVLIGRGEADQMVSEAESLAVAGALPNGQYVLLPKVRHPWEQIALQQMSGYWFT